MRRDALASGVLAASALCALALPARADDAVPATDLVQVRADRRADAGTVVTTIDDAAISRFGTTNVGETLERLPAFSSGESARGERILSLRGFDQRQLAVFIDGVPVYAPYDGRMDLAKLPVAMVSRITVIGGSGAVLYGPNGLGGAVNITTREPTTLPSLQAASEVSVPRASRGSLIGSAGVGGLRGVLGAGFESVRSVPLSSSFTARPNESGPDRTNSDRLDGTVASKWVWALGERHRLTLSASRLEGRYGVPPATRDLSVRYWRWTDWASSAVGLSHAYDGGAFQIESLVYGSAFGNTLDAYDDARYASQLLPRAFHSIYDDTSLGGFVRTSYTAALGDRRALRLRSWSGVKHDAHASIADRNAETVTVTTNELTTSALAEVDVVPSWVRTSAGAQLDFELPGAPPSGAKPSTAAALGPLASVGVTPGRAWSLTANAASRTRFPTLRERFSTAFGSIVANPDLRPEHAWSFSLDAVYKPSRALRVAVGLFDSEVTDLVATVVVAPQTQQLQNATGVRFVGAEAHVTCAPTPWLDVLAGWMTMQVRTENGEPLAYKPENKGLVGLTVTPWPAVSFGAVVRYVGAQDFQNPDTAAWGRLGGYALVDARVDWRAHPGVTAWVRATNVADANVEARYSFPEAGRQVFVGLSARLGS